MISTPAGTFYFVFFLNHTIIFLGTVYGNFDKKNHYLSNPLPSLASKRPFFDSHQ